MPGPWTPITWVAAMSDVPLGPLIKLTALGRSGGAGRTLRRPVAPPGPYRERAQYVAETATRREAGTKKAATGGSSE